MIKSSRSLLRRRVLAGCLGSALVASAAACSSSSGTSTAAGADQSSGSTVSASATGGTGSASATGGAPGSESAAVSTSSATSASTGGSPSNVSGTLQILVSSAAASDAAFEQLNAEFHAANPKVTVKFSTVPNADFKASRSSRLTAHNLDVTVAQLITTPSYVTGGSESDDSLAADAGLFLDLSKQPFMSRFTPSVLDAIRYKGKDFTVPTGLSYYTGVFYNKAIFQRYNLSVPTTWAAFQTVEATLKAHGVTPLAIGGKDSWPAGLLMLGAVQSLYPTVADKSALAEGIWKKQVDLSTGTPLKVLQRVKTLYDSAQKNFAGVSYNAIPSLFASGAAAMTVDGTWNQVTIDQAIKGKFGYGYFPLPVSDKAADNALLAGKVELRLAVPSNAPNKAAALAYLNFFSQPAAYKKFVQTSGFAPVEPNMPVSSFLQSISTYTTQFSPAWDQIWVPNTNAGQAAVFPFNYPAIAPLGTLSPEAAAHQAQTAWNAG